MGKIEDDVRLDAMMRSRLIKKSHDSMMSSTSVDDSEEEE